MSISRRQAVVQIIYPIPEKYSGSVHSICKIISLCIWIIGHLYEALRLLCHYVINITQHIEDLT